VLGTSASFALGQTRLQLNGEGSFVASREGSSVIPLTLPSGKFSPLEAKLEDLDEDEEGLEPLTAQEDLTAADRSVRNPVFDAPTVVTGGSASVASGSSEGQVVVTAAPDGPEAQEGDLSVVVQDSQDGLGVRQG
jgi:hypothetical protein